MWELDYKESWVLKNWSIWTVVLEKTFESPLDCKELNQSMLKEINPEYSLEELILRLKLQYFGHLMGRTDSLGKTLMLGKIEGWRRRRQQRIRWFGGHRFDGPEFEKAPGVGDGWDSLAYCSLWSLKELDTTEQLNWSELNWEHTQMASLNGLV